MQHFDQQSESAFEIDYGTGSLDPLLASRMSTAIGVFTAEGNATLVNPALAALFPAAGEVQLRLILQRLLELDGTPADVSQDLARHGRWYGVFRLDAGSAPSLSPVVGAVLTEMRSRSAWVIGYICEVYPQWSGASTAPSSPHLKLLTVRENEVLRELVAGGSNKGIGRTLNVSSRTIEFHRANIMRKLSVSSLTELLRVFHGR
ncbi:MAG: helix-turn-helix transcriptional regulator [Novosphingobium sp.]